MPRIAVISVAHIHSHSFCKDICARSSLGHPAVIWDENPDRGRRYAEEFGCPYEPDLDKVLADGSLEAFAVCAENTRHMPLLQRVLPLGRPTLCEKPLATTADDADEIEALVRRHGTPLVSGYFQPFFAHNRGVAKLLSEGVLGTVTHLNFRNAHNAAYGRWFDSPDLSWFTDPALSGGGALLDMGTHAVHLLRHLGGPVREVWCTTANLSGAYPAVDDWGVIEMRFANGVQGRVEAGWVFAGTRGGLEVVASKGAVFETADGLVTRAPGEDARPVPGADSRPDRIARLVALARGELSTEEVAADLDACLDAVRIMDAAYRSAATGQWTPVPQSPANPSTRR